MQSGQRNDYPWDRLPDNELAKVEGFESFNPRGRVNEHWPRTDVALRRGSRIADKQTVIAALDQEFSGFGGDYMLRRDNNDRPGIYSVSLGGQGGWEVVDLGEVSPAAERLRIDEMTLERLNKQAGPENEWGKPKRNAHGEWNEKTIEFLKCSKEEFERHDSWYLRSGLKSTFRCFTKMENAKAAQEYAYGYSQLLFHWLQRGHDDGDKDMHLFAVPGDIAELTETNALAVKKAFFESVPENVQTSIGQILPSNTVKGDVRPIAKLGKNILEELQPGDPDREKIAAKIQNVQDILDENWISSQPLSTGVQQRIVRKEANARQGAALEAFALQTSPPITVRKRSIVRKNLGWLPAKVGPLKIRSGTLGSKYPKAFSEPRGEATTPLLAQQDQNFDQRKTATVQMNDAIAAPSVSGVNERDSFHHGARFMTFAKTNDPDEISAMPNFANGDRVLQWPHIVRRGDRTTGKFEEIDERLKRFEEFVLDPQGRPKDLRIKAKPKFDQDDGMHAFTLTDSQKTKADLRVDSRLAALLLTCSQSRFSRWQFSVDQDNGVWQVLSSKSGRQPAASSKDTQSIMDRASSTAYMSKGQNIQSRK
jgi:hypothetical protein